MQNMEMNILMVLLKCDKTDAVVTPFTLEHDDVVIKRETIERINSTPFQKNFESLPFKKLYL